MYEAPNDYREYYELYHAAPSITDWARNAGTAIRKYGKNAKQGQSKEHPRNALGYDEQQQLANQLRALLNRAGVGANQYLMNGNWRSNEARIALNNAVSKCPPEIRSAAQQVLNKLMQAS